MNASQKYINRLCLVYDIVSPLRNTLRPPVLLDKIFYMVRFLTSFVLSSSTGYLQVFAVMKRIGFCSNCTTNNFLSSVYVWVKLYKYCCFILSKDISFTSVVTLDTLPSVCEYFHSFIQSTKIEINCYCTKLSYISSYGIHTKTHLLFSHVKPKRRLSHFTCYLHRLILLLFTTSVYRVIEVLFYVPEDSRGWVVKDNSLIVSENRSSNPPPPLYKLTSR